MGLLTGDDRIIHCGDLRLAASAYEGGRPVAWRHESCDGWAFFVVLNGLSGEYSAGVQDAGGRTVGSGTVRRGLLPQSFRGGFFEAYREHWDG